MATSSQNDVHEDVHNQIVRGVIRKIPFIDCGGFVVTIATSRRSTIRAGESALWHTHPYNEFSFIRKGEVTYRTHTETLARSAGDVDFLPTGIEHAWTMTKGDCTIDNFMIEFHSTGNVQMNSVIAGFAKKRGYTLTLPGEAKDHYASIDRELALRGQFMEKRLTLLIYDIFYLMLRENFGEFFSAQRNEAAEGSLRIFLAAKEMIEAKVATNIGIQDIARALSLSPRYLNQVFKEAGELPCGKYIQERRLRKAYRMITENPTMKIREIAATLGYTDELYFSRVFTKRFSLAPSAVRENDPF
ncbi:MAG: AraC family transcriptional regulator [Spirochaetota bacterium]